MLTLLRSSRTGHYCDQSKRCDVFVQLECADVLPPKRHTTWLNFLHHQKHLKFVHVVANLILLYRAAFPSVQKFKNCTGAPKSWHLKRNETSKNSFPDTVWFVNNKCEVTAWNVVEVKHWIKTSHTELLLFALHSHFDCKGTAEGRDRWGRPADTPLMRSILRSCDRKFTFGKGRHSKYQTMLN